MKRLAALLLALTVATPAWGATYYVSPTGNASASGADTLDNAKNLGWTNIAANMAPGDIVYLKNGAYPEPIHPTEGGSSGSRVSWIGNISAPNAVSVAYISLDSLSGCTGYVTVKGVASRNKIDLKARGPSAHYDTVTYCHSANGFALSGRGNATITNCFLGDGIGNDELGISANEYNRTPRSVYVAGLSFTDNNCKTRTTGGQGGNSFNMRLVRDGTFSRNRIYGEYAPTAWDRSIGTWYYVRSMTVANNHFSGLSQSDAQESFYLINFRDSHIGNTFDTDTIVEVQGGLRPLKVGIITSGNDVDGVFDQGDRNNAWHNCYVKSRDLIEMQTYMHNSTFHGNTFITGKHILLGETGTYTDSLVLRHNTLVSFGNNIITHVDGRHHSITAASNIYWLNGRKGGDNGCGGYSQGMISYGSSNATPGFADSNLVWSTTPGDSTAAFGTGGCAWTHLSEACADYSVECRSHWGDPEFAETEFWSFDHSVSPTGIAISSDLWADGYVGAKNIAADQTAPVLVVTWPPSAQTYRPRERLRFEWTVSDNVGVERTDLHISDNLDGPWKLAYTNDGTSPVTWGLMIPANLTSADLYVRIRARDSAGNVAEKVQNFVIETTLSGPSPFEDIAD